MKKAMCLLIGVLFLLSEQYAMAESDVPPYEQVMEQLYEEQELRFLEDGEAGEILTLQLHQEMQDAVYYTFSDTRTLTGSASPGDRIAAVVYTEGSGGRPIIWYHHETVIGESGMYQETVPLQLLDMQWILIAVWHQDELACRVYGNHRKSDRVLSELLDYELSLYEEFGK